jgi:hypothetical protein
MTTSPKPGQQDHSADLKHLRRECQARLDALGLPTPCDISTLCNHLSQQRDRPIQLVPMTMQASHPCGILVASDTTDFIFYDANTSKPHQEHIVMHELAHIICCHRGSGGLDDASIGLLFPDVDPELVRDMLRRTTYSHVQEREAEIMASLILRRRYPKATEFGGSNLPESTKTLARITISLMRHDMNT